MNEKLNKPDLGEETQSRGREFLSRLVTELEQRGHVVGTHRLPMMEIGVVDDESVYFRIEEQTRYASTVTGYSPTGRLRYITGLNRRKNYPEPKKGFNLETAITRILAEVETRKSKHRAARKREALDEAAEKTLERACQLLGVEYSFRTIEGVSFNKGVETHVDVRVMLTPEELVKFVEDRRANQGIEE